MTEDLPKFTSEKELAEWFESADLSKYNLEEALDVIVATRVQLSIEPPPSETTSAGQTGTLQGDVHLVGT